MKKYLNVSGQESKERATNKIVLTSFFLCITFIVQVIEFPIYYFLSIDATLGILVLSTFFLPNRNVLIVTVFAPLATFFGIGGGDPVGFLILETIYVSFISSFLFQSNFIKSVSLKILISNIFSLMILWSLNLILFYPAYFGFDYGSLFAPSNFYSYLRMVTIFTFVSSISRFIFSFLIFLLLKKTLKK